METLARDIAAAHLDARVERHDDGSRNSMPDASITYTDGRHGWLEVVRSIEGDHLEQRKRVDQGNSLHVDGLHWPWVIHVEHHVKIKHLDRWLPRLLREAETAAGEDERGAGASAMRCGKGLAYASPRGHGTPGEVTVRSTGDSGSATSEDLQEWIVEFLQGNGDVADTLTKAGPADERHAFVWTDAGTAPAAFFVLAQRGAVHLPPADPSLPIGITHLWIAGAGTADRAIAWFPDRRWHEVSTHWTGTPAGRALLDAAGKSPPHS